MQKVNKPRNWVVPIMVENTKSGPMKDKKKEKNRKKCREKICYEKMY